jgi:hypothetical protein
MFGLCWHRLKKEFPMNETKCWTSKVGSVLCIALLGTLTGLASNAAEISVGITIHAESDFYEPLTPHGEWVVVGSYGRCWRPSRMVVGWRPYCNGSWQRTDDGWYWVSDEPWGWATYHYGRWDYSAEFGWYWVPRTVWAPAWVSWHSGGGYIGWAPLSPSGRVEVRDISTRVVFVEERRFLEPIRSSTVVADNTAIVTKTVISKGPDTAAIEKASGRKVAAVQVRELRHKEEAAVVTKHPAKPEGKPEAKPQVEKKPEAKPEIVQPPKHEPKPEAKPEAKPDKNEDQPEAKPDGEKHGPKQDKPDKEKKGEE